MDRSLPKLPLLIYDGDCPFCRFWVDYWKTWTKGSVSHAPFQEVAERFPEISRERFRSAVHLVQPDGTISSGAEAVFRSLSHAPGKEWMLRCYLRVPGFRIAADRAYRFVASHRNGLFRITRLLWRKPLKELRSATGRDS